MAFLTANFLYLLVPCIGFIVLFFILAICKSGSQFKNLSREANQVIAFADHQQHIQRFHKTMFKDVWQLVVCIVGAFFSFILFGIGFVGWVVELWSK